MFAAVMRPVEGLSPETLLTLNVEKSLIGLVGTRRPAISIIQLQSVLFFKLLIRNKAQRLRSLE
jgi:hypothetical protein